MSTIVLGARLEPEKREFIKNLAGKLHIQESDIVRMLVDALMDNRINIDSGKVTDFSKVYELAKKNDVSPQEFIDFVTEQFE